MGYRLYKALTTVPPGSYLDVERGGTGHFSNSIQKRKRTVQTSDSVFPSGHKHLTQHDMCMHMCMHMCMWRTGPRPPGTSGASGVPIAMAIPCSMVPKQRQRARTTAGEMRLAFPSSNVVRCRRMPALGRAACYSPLPPAAAWRSISAHASWPCWRAIVSAVSPSQSAALGSAPARSISCTHAS